MSKRLLLLGIGIFCLATIVGCSYHKNLTASSDKTEIQQVSQNRIINEGKKSNICGLENVCKDTMEIEIDFDSNVVHEIKPVQVKDRKMVFDILTMINKSTLISDESKINSMSGMATKNNKLVFIKKNGEKKEITFAYDDPAFALGYLDIEGEKYDPGFSFFRYIKDFIEYRQFNTNIDTKVEDLFKKYKWTVDYRVNTVKKTLPADFSHNAGEYPTKIYWAYNNELSKNIGLDYRNYLGKDIDVEIYRLREPLPEYMEPRMNARGIILKYNDKMIGAYIDAGRHDCFGCSLDRKNIKDITGINWNGWVKGYINYRDSLEISFSKMNPEEIIKQYYKAMDNHNEKVMFGCMNRQNLCSYLSANMDNNELFNTGFNGVYADGKQNVKKAKLIQLREIKGSDNPKGILKYEATVEFQFKKAITSNNGIQSRYIVLKKDSESSGWRISSEGTGP